MKKTLGLQIALATFVLASSAAQSADLLGLYNEAKTYDAQFAAARASLDAGREALPQGRSGLLPQIGASANTVWNETETKILSNGVKMKSDYNTNGWSVNLTQPLFRWQNWVSYTQSELAVAVAEAQFAQASQDLIVRVAQSYFDVLQAQEVLASTQAQKVAITEQLESAKRNFEVGTSTITDTHEAQARYDLADAQLFAAESDLTVKREILRTVVGKAHDDLKLLKTGVQIPRPQPDDIDRWAKQAETGNVSVQVAQSNAEIADQEVSKQRAGHFPTLDAVASRSKNAVGNNPLFGTGYDTTATTVGLQLQVPIFAGGYTSSKQSEAAALRQKAIADLESARRGASLQARQAYVGVSSGLAQVKALEAALVSSQSAVDSNKLGYDVGVRINIDVLNAQSQYFDTRQKLMKARLDTLLAQLKLKAAAGNLTEDDLKAVNSLLD